MLRIYNYQKNEGDIKEFEDEIKKNLPETIFSHDLGLDFNDVPWEDYTGDGDMGIDKDFIKDRLHEVRDIHGDFIDIISFAVPSEDWEADGIWGWHLGGQIYNYEVIMFEMRDRYWDTAEHEVLHTFDNFVYAYCGYRLIDKLPYEGDFDEIIVHAKAPGIKEYHWDDLMKEIRPHIRKAIMIRRRRISQNMFDRTLTGVRKSLLRLREDITMIEGKKKERTELPSGMKVRS